MNIPLELQPFKHATLIVVTDSVQAKLFLAQDRNVRDAGHITSNYPPKDNEERSSGESPSGIHFAEQSEHTEEITRERLYAALSKELMERLQKKEFEELVFTVPQEHFNELKESVHVQLLKIAKIWVPKLLTNDDIKDILIHIEETDFPDE
jgi:protein required for attachment to host cells